MSHRGILCREEFSDSGGKHGDETGVAYRVASGRPKVSQLNRRKDQSDEAGALRERGSGPRNRRT